MLVKLFKKYFSQSTGDGLIAKLANTHNAIVSAERQRNKERHAAERRITGHEWKITKCRLAIKLHREAIRCEQRELDLLEVSRTKQIRNLRAERNKIVDHLHAPPVDREAVELARLLELETSA